MFPRAVKQVEIPAYRLFTLDTDSVKRVEVFCVWGLPTQKHLEL